MQYGIKSENGNSATGNTPVTGANALIQNSVFFILSGPPTDFELPEALFSDIIFQYGTSLNDPSVPVPEPATLFLLGSGLLGLTEYGGRKKIFKK